MKKWFTLICAIFSEVAGSLSLKAALDHPAWFALVAIGYFIAFAFLVSCLRQGMKIGVAYGIWGAGGVALTAIFSAVIFAEPLTGVMALGIALIMGGVLVVELGSQQAQQATREQAGIDPKGAAA